MIIQNLRRSEKYLCFLAAGKWILKPQFLTDSIACKGFLEEEHYEWGDDDFNQNTNDAPRRNRLEVARTGQGPFFGWRVILCAKDTARQTSFEHLMEAGGGIIVHTKPPFTDLNVCHSIFYD